MAVIRMWQVDRDKTMHTSRAEADKHDLMLEIGEHFSVAIKSIVPEIAQSQAEAIGLFLSRNREAVAKLCKGSNDIAGFRRSHPAVRKPWLNGAQKMALR